MKKLILFALILLPLASIAQINQLSNFSIEDKSLVYKNIFAPADTADVKARILDQLRLNTGIRNVQDRGNFITAEIENMEIDYAKYGGKRSMIPMFALNPINARLRIEVKDGRYRSIVNDIQFKDDTEINYGAGVSSKIGTLTLDEFVLTKDRASIKSGKGMQSVLFFLDKHFEDTFTLKQNTAAADDW